MSDADNLRQRSATPEDMPYVFSTWMRSYGSRIPPNRPDRDGRIVDFRRGYVDRIMKMDPHIVLLCSPTSPRTLHSYAVAVRGGLAWAYTTRELRGMGLAKRCITAALREYPDVVRAFCDWPWESSRYKFERLRIAK